MPDVGSIIAFGVASVALLLIPGPAVIYILNRSVSDGREVGLAAVAGLELGNFVHVIAASAGLSAVLATYGFPKFAVPIETALAPAIMSSRASRPFVTPPIPRMGVFLNAA